MSLTDSQLAEYIGTYTIWQFLREQKNYAEADKWRKKYARWDRMLTSPWKNGGIEWHRWFADLEIQKTLPPKPPQRGYSSK